MQHNNYPRKLVQNIINYNLNIRNSRAPGFNERSNSKEIFINLKACVRYLLIKFLFFHQMIGLQKL